MINGDSDGGTVCAIGIFVCPIWLKLVLAHIPGDRDHHHQCGVFILPPVCGGPISPVSKKKTGIKKAGRFDRPFLLLEGKGRLFVFVLFFAAIVPQFVEGIGYLFKNIIVFDQA